MSECDCCRVIGPSPEQQMARVVESAQRAAEAMGPILDRAKVYRHSSPEEIARVLADPNTIVCYSRCMWCGRQTPHEWCHQCSERVMKGGRPWSTWHRYSRSPETCEFDDEHCPVMIRCNAYLSQVRFAPQQSSG